MKKLALIFLTSFLLLSILLVQNGKLPTVNASIYEGDLIINGNTTYTIENQRFDINGSILVEDNATLILRNAIINFTGSSQGIYLQNPADGNPKLQAENTTVMNDSFYNRFYGNSSATLSNCTLSGFYIHDTANTAIANSTINFMKARDSPTLSLANSTLEYMDITSKHANVSIINLSSGFIALWDYWLNCSLTLSPSGEAPHITLMSTTVTQWHFSFQPTDASEIINSQIWYLHTNGLTHIVIHNSTVNNIELYGSSTVELTNSTYTETLRLYNDAKIYVNWYLTVHVIDSVGQNVPLANVTATYPNATVAETKLTDDNGLARLPLMEKMINATGEYLIGNYIVNATYETHSNSTETLSMTENKQITIPLDFIIPEFPTQIIATLFMLTTLLTAIAYKKKRIADRIQH